MKKRILAMLLSVAMVASMFSVLSITALAKSPADASLTAVTHYALADGVSLDLTQAATKPDAVNSLTPLGKSGTTYRYLYDESSGKAKYNNVTTEGSANMVNDNYDINADVGSGHYGTQTKANNLALEDVLTNPDEPFNLDTNPYKNYLTVDVTLPNKSTVNSIVVSATASSNNVIGHYYIYASNDKGTLYSTANFVGEFNPYAIGAANYSNDMRTQTFTFAQPKEATYIGMLTSRFAMPDGNNDYLRVLEFNAYGTSSGMSVIRRSANITAIPTDLSAYFATRATVRAATEGFKKLNKDGEYVSVNYTSNGIDKRNQLRDGNFESQIQLNTVGQGFRDNYDETSGESDVAFEMIYDLRDNLGNGANITGIVADLGGCTSTFNTSTYKIYVANTLKGIFSEENVVADVDEWDTDKYPTINNLTFVTFDANSQIAQNAKFVAIRATRVNRKGAKVSDGLYPRWYEFDVYGSRVAPQTTPAFEFSNEVVAASDNLISGKAVEVYNKTQNGVTTNDTLIPAVASAITDGVMGNGTQNSSVNYLIKDEGYVTDDASINSERYTFKLDGQANVDKFTINSLTNQNFYPVSHARFYASNTLADLYDAGNCVADSYELDATGYFTVTLNEAVSANYVGFEFVAGTNPVNADAVLGYFNEPYRHCARIGEFEVHGNYVGGTADAANVTAEYGSTAPSGLAPITKSELKANEGANADESGNKPAVVTITAAAGTNGYVFDGWYKDSVKVSSDLAYDAPAGVVATYKAEYSFVPYKVNKYPTAASAAATVAVGQDQHLENNLIEEKSPTSAFNLVDGVRTATNEKISRDVTKPELFTGEKSNGPKGNELFSRDASGKIINDESQYYWENIWKLDGEATITGFTYLCNKYNASYPADNGDGSTNWTSSHFKVSLADNEADLFNSDAKVTVEVANNTHGYVQILFNKEYTAKFVAIRLITPSRGDTFGGLVDNCARISYIGFYGEYTNPVADATGCTIAPDPTLPDAAKTALPVTIDSCTPKGANDNNGAYAQQTVTYTATETATVGNIRYTFKRWVKPGLDGIISDNLQNTGVTGGTYYATYNQEDIRFTKFGYATSNGEDPADFSAVDAPAKSLIEGKTGTASTFVKGLDSNPYTCDVLSVTDADLSFENNLSPLASNKVDLNTLTFDGLAKNEGGNVTAFPDDETVYYNDIIFELDGEATIDRVTYLCNKDGGASDKVGDLASTKWAPEHFKVFVGDSLDTLYQGSCYDVANNKYGYVQLGFNSGYKPTGKFVAIRIIKPCGNAALGGYNLSAIVDNRINYLGVYGEYTAPANTDDVTAQYDTEVGAKIGLAAITKTLVGSGADDKNGAFAKGTAKLTAAAAPTGYKFTGWTNSEGDTVGTDLELATPLTAGTYTANYAVDTVKVTVKDGTGKLVYTLNVEAGTKLNDTQIDELKASIKAFADENPIYGYELWEDEDNYNNMYFISENYCAADEENRDAIVADQTVTVKYHRISKAAKVTVLVAGQEDEQKSFITKFDKEINLRNIFPGSTSVKVTSEELSFVTNDAIIYCTGDMSVEETAEPADATVVVDIKHLDNTLSEGKKAVTILGHNEFDATKTVVKTGALVTTAATAAAIESQGKDWYEDFYLDATKAAYMSYAEIESNIYNFMVGFKGKINREYALRTFVVYNDGSVELSDIVTFTVQ